jgi:hypothetical protein
MEESDVATAPNCKIPPHVTGSTWAEVVEPRPEKECVVRPGSMLSKPPRMEIKESMARNFFHSNYHA